MRRACVRPFDGAGPDAIAGPDGGGGGMFQRIDRRRFAFCCVALLAQASAISTALAAGDTVRVGIIGTISDAGLLIADRKGYFNQEGINAVFTAFDSAARMVAPLGAGQLDVGAGSASAGLYNAVARGIAIKIVADKGSTPPGYGFSKLLVRKDHLDSGRYRSLKDLKGMRVAGLAPGTGSMANLNAILLKAGLHAVDIERVFMGYPQHVLALQNKAIDAALTAEPSATQAIRTGAAVAVLSDDETYPDHQIAVVLYSGDFGQRRPEVARRFMRAYLKGVRDYNDALKDGRLAGPHADEVIRILTEATEVKDAALYRAITPSGCNPNGRVHVASLKRDLDYYRADKQIEGDVTVEQLVDHSYVDWAVKELGPYQRRR
jgi:NitT/TauT family transport system substrate-binding protein